MEALLACLEQNRIRVRRDFPLSDLSSFRIGGPARAVVEPETSGQLIFALRAISESGCRMLTVGNGSNLLFPDNGFDGVIVRTTFCREWKREGNGFFLSAGVRLGTLAAAARDAELSGAEFCYGIPGTVGGGVFMNAGAFGGEMAQITVSSDFYDLSADACGTLTGAEQAFGARTSVYASCPERVILGARVVLQEGDQREIQERMDDCLARRKSTQPLEYPSAGSVFKRPAEHFAGKLIEDCGLKNTRIGGAVVSAKHAGFIVNVGGATACDVLRLIELIETTVQRETGVALEREIRIVN